MPGGVSKRDYLDYQVHSALAEGSRYDLIAMGRGEGPGCYCAVNHNLREVIDSISKHYAYVVIDNEAGMEHLSRRTTRDVQHLLIVSDPTPRGLIAAHRIADMGRELEINLEKIWLVLNRVSREIPSEVRLLVEGMGAPLLAAIPADDDLGATELAGRPLVGVGNDSRAYRAVDEMMSQMLG
jgi:CO dehydrogenase maturation factor